MSPDLEPANPTDAALRDVTDAIDEPGASQFGAREGGTIVCFTCHRELDASTVSADRSTRLEGVSDPADMVMVVPVTCPNCGAEGSLVLHYGALASAAEADVLTNLERTPRVGAAGEEPTPGVTEAS